MPFPENDPVSPQNPSDERLYWRTFDYVVKSGDAMFSGTVTFSFNPTRDEVLQDVMECGACWAVKAGVPWSTFNCSVCFARSGAKGT